MLAPRGINGRPAQDEVVRSHRRRSLIPAGGVMWNVLVETAPPVPRNALRVQLVPEQPGPGKIARPPVRRRSSGADPDQLVEESDGSDDHSAELRAVENRTGTQVDAERPRRVVCVTRPDVSRERASGRYCSSEVSPVAGELVEAEIPQSEECHLVGLASSVEAARHPGEAAPVASRSGAARREWDAGPRPARRRRPMPELVVQHPSD